jgi:predicted small lipoprotein YifL
MVEESDLVGTSGFSRLALIGALAGALALGACGRKGLLEAPPSANAVPAGGPQVQQQVQQQSQARQPSLGENEQPGFEDPRNQDPQQLPPSKRTFILDPIL